MRRPPPSPRPKAADTNSRIYRRPLSVETKTRIILAVGVLAYLLALIPNLIDLF